MSVSKSMHDDLLARFIASTDLLLDSGGNGEQEPAKCKIAKLNETGNSDVSLKELQFTRILNISPKGKRICIEAQYEDSPAIVVLEKTPFEAEITEHVIANFGDSLSNVKNLFRNDIYGSYLVDIVLNGVEQKKNNLNQIFISIIHPARPKDIEKYLDHPMYLIRETAELFNSVTKPFIDAQVNTPGHLQWLYNILEHKAETDRIIYEENLDNDLGFIMVKDMKWKCNKEQLSDLEKSEIYINALLIRRDLHSIRDLTHDHLPLLEAIYYRGRKAIADKFSISPQELRVFIHYQPSFYHLHVHFTHIKAEAGGFQSERAYMLSTVIENIRLLPDYFQRVTLEFPLSTASELKREQYEASQIN